MSRKVTLTFGLILVGQESRSYIGLALVIAGMYGILFCWIRTIQDEFENMLMSASLAVTVFNLAVGAVSRIPAENIEASMNQFLDAVLLDILALGANALVIGLLFGEKITVFIIQLCFLEYKYRAKRVQTTDICTRLIPPGRVKFKTLASQNFGKRNRWIINLLLDVLVCSIDVYFYSLFVF